MRRLSLSGKIGLALLGVFVVLGVCGPWLAPYALQSNLDGRFAPGSAAHWLGTDRDGIDVLSQLLHGARAALLLSVLVVTISATTGLILGTLAGYFRGVIDDVIMRLVDILMAFPGMLLNIAIVATVRNPGLGVLVFALCVNGWVGYARVVRASVLSLRERDFVTAATALGATHARVIRRHIIPNALAPALVQMSFGFGGVIMVEASLSFLGLYSGGSYSWGAMLEQGTSHLWKAGFGVRYALVGGLAIMWVVLGANLLGDALRDLYDPKRRGRA